MTLTKPIDESYWEPDPVMGLVDVARGRTVLAPTTIYLLRNKDRSGVMGLLQPSGEFVPKRKSTTGQVFLITDGDGEVFEGLVQWDGAQPSPRSATPLGWWDEEETSPIYEESSKGVLLGNYSENGELWNSVAIGRAMI